MLRIIWFLFLVHSIDAFGQTETKVVQSDGVEGGIFGSGVSISGDYAVVGAGGDSDNGTQSGSAFIFEREDATWIEVAKLGASDGVLGDIFGRDVDINGGYVIVGAIGDDDNGTNSGSAYIFERQGANWVEVAKLVASDGAELDEFGRNVSIDDDYAIIGVPLHDDGGDNSGAAYIFERQGVAWVEVAKLAARDRNSGDNFGGSVSISKDHAVVGAPFNDDDGEESGSVYIFERQGSSWVEVAKLLASDAAENDRFGISVSIDDGYVVVGADFDDAGSENSGSAYIFERQGSSWAEMAKLIPTDGAENDLFGRSVSISGDSVIVGAIGDDDNGASSGAAYVFERKNTEWIEVSKLRASDGAERDLFGYGVSISGSHSIVGTPFINDNFGAAYIYGPDRASPSITSTALTSGFIGGEYAYRVVAAGYPPPTFSLSAAPEGMEISDPTSGLITWVPQTAGSFPVTTVATNSVGSDQQSFTITVTESVRSATITSVPITEATVGAPYMYDVEADGNPDPTFVLTTSPPGMIINESTGNISWTPSNPGRFVVIVAVTNGVGSADIQSFSIAVTEALSVLTRNESFEDFTAPTSYRLVSLPGDLDLDIGATFNGEPGIDWNAFFDNGADGGDKNEYFIPYRSGRDQFRFRPGRGFWVLSKTNWSVNESGVLPAPLDADGHFILDIHAGWNIISSPFTESISWESVKEANRLAVTARIFSYDGIQFSSSATMEPYKAYYYDSVRRNLRLPHPSFQVSGKSEAVTSLHTLTVQATDNNSMEASARIVLHEEAEQGLDNLDQRAPRDDFAALSLGFEIGDPVLHAVDARPEILEGSVFDLVLKAEKGQEIQIEVEGDAAFEGLEMAFVADGELIKVTEGNPITLRLGGEVNRYQLLVGPESYIVDKREEFVPEMPVIRQNYPNPFSSSTTIEYAVPESGSVKIQVFDVLGRLVTVLVEGEREAGRHDVLWQGVDGNGQKVPAGTYFIQLQVKSGARSVIAATKLE